MHSSRGFFVSGQQQQIGFPVLMPNFCSFGLVASCYALQKRKKQKKRTKPNGEIHQAGATGKYQETVSCEREGDKRVGFIYR
jgi:hypothetical protein